MADTNQSRRADFLDDDPFAELTRIMGHDPREPRGEAAQALPSTAGAPLSESMDDFDVDFDLEKELMGELDLSEFDDQPALDAVQPEVDWRAFDEPVEQAQDAFSRLEPETPAAQPEAVYADAPAAGSAAAEAEPALSLEDEDFGAALERELFGGQEEPAFEHEATYAPAAYSAPVAEPAAEEAVAVASFEGAAEDAVVAEFADDEFDLAFLEEEIAPEADAAYQPVEPEPAPSWDHEPAEEPLAYQAVEETDVPAAGDADFGDEPVSHAAAEPAAFEHVSWEPADEIVDEPVKQPFFSAPEPAPLSLEDELNALLSDGTEPVSHAIPAVQEDSWHPSVETFGRANFTAPVSDEPVPSWEPAAPAAVAEPAQNHAQAASPAAETDVFADIFGDDFSLDVEEQVAEQPEPARAQVQPAAVAGLAALSQWLPRSSQPAVQPAPRTDAPDVETVDLVEAAPAVVDDLDIPEVDYASPEPRAYDTLDDIETEFAQAFGDFPQAEQPEPIYAHAATAATQAGEEHHIDAYSLGEGEWQSSGQPADDGFDYETDLEHAIAMSAYEDDVAERPAPRKRGLLVAALVAGVALIGGAGVFGMSFFGGGSDGPAMLRADTDPMKVRPENPGGTTVPNQDSQAYERVAGGQREAAPGQERLISTAEEPVDVTAQAQTPALAPGVSDDDLSALESAELDAALKSEERLDPADTAPVAGASEEVAAVAPRRVRTMVVRPDGTLVPREELEQPTGAVPEQPAESVLGAGPALAAPALAPANALQAATGQADVLSAEEDGGPVVNTPPTVSVVPSRRVEPQAVAAAPVVQQPAVQQQPAATPVSAPAAAAPSGASSEWSMQIASQPTAEGAQATYQDLARRYGSVLEGRGVNVVRANIEGMGTYYRVRIPAASRDEAIQLCTRYKAAGGSCFVSR